MADSRWKAVGGESADGMVFGLLLGVGGGKRECKGSDQCCRCARGVTKHAYCGSSHTLYRPHASYMTEHTQQPRNILPTSFPANIPVPGPAEVRAGISRLLPTQRPTHIHANVGIMLVGLRRGAGRAGGECHAVQWPVARVGRMWEK
jgi:hypothetical protein